MFNRVDVHVILQNRPGMNFERMSLFDLTDIFF